MKLAEVINYLDYELHPEYQEDYDNAGFLLGNPMVEYSGALVALDLTMDVIDEAHELGLNLIATHHPFIYSGVKRITTMDLTGRMIHRLIEYGISVYAAHTNLDNLKWGISGTLAEKLGMTKYRVLRVAEGKMNENVGGGVIGTLEKPIPTKEFINKIKEVLQIKNLRCSPLCKNEIRKVALCGGSGSFMIGDAIKNGADIYVTSDLKYHDFQRAENRIILCDAGHYETEQFAKEIIYYVISKKFSNFACRISDSGNPYVRNM